MEFDPWTADAHQVTALQLLTWLDGATTGGQSRKAREFVDAGTVFTVEDDDLDTMLRTLRAAELVHLDSRMSKPAGGFVDITADGRTLVRQVESQQRDAMARESACEEALLDWVAAISSGGSRDTGDWSGFLSDPRSFFYGDQFSNDEIGSAIWSLKEEDYVTGLGVSGYPYVLRARLSAKGKQVARRRRGIQSTLQDDVATQHFTTNFHGPMSGQIAVGNHTTQSQGTLLSAAEFGALLDTVREAADGLPGGDRERALTYVDVIQAEAGEDDRTMSDGAISKLTAIAKTAGSTALTTAVQTYVQATMT